jgi:hypothetical protein
MDEDSETDVSFEGVYEPLLDSDRVYATAESAATDQ